MKGRLRNHRGLSKSVTFAVSHPSYANVSPREKIEMRGHLATTAGYRNPPPSRSVTRFAEESSYPASS